MVTATVEVLIPFQKRAISSVACKIPVSLLDDARLQLLYRQTRHRSHEAPCAEAAVEGSCMQQLSLRRTATALVASSHDGPITSLSRIRPNCCGGPVSVRRSSFNGERASRSAGDRRLRLLASRARLGCRSSERKSSPGRMAPG